MFIGICGSKFAGPDFYLDEVSAQLTVTLQVFALVGERSPAI